MGRCSFRGGWWSGHPPGDGGGHLRKDPAERAALQRGSCHLREPGGAVHPGPENSEFRSSRFPFRSLLEKGWPRLASSLVSSIIFAAACPPCYLSSPSLSPRLCRSWPCRTGGWCAAVGCLRCLTPTSLTSRSCHSFRGRSSSSMTCCWWGASLKWLSCRDAIDSMLLSASVFDLSPFAVDLKAVSQEEKLSLVHLLQGDGSPGHAVSPLQQRV